MNIRRQGRGPAQATPPDQEPEPSTNVPSLASLNASVEALNGAIGVLNPRERRIFEARRLAEDPMTLEDLASEFGVSRERVRQIEVRAFEKVQAAVKASVALAQIPGRRAAPALPAP